MNTYYLTRSVFKKALGFIYFIGFLILINQFKALFGENGLLPAINFIKQVPFKFSPSLFYLNASDSVMMAFAIFGLLLSLFAMSGLSEKFGILISSLTWFFLWVIYLSFVNVGQVFYGFGWEILLLEMGFLVLFLGSGKNTDSPKITIWLIRWLLFRLMFGAGLIKIRGDSCWLDFTCMFYHYETQPMPHMLSWYFHHMPAVLHKLAIWVNHFVELIVPFGFFGPRKIRIAAGLITTAFQTILIFSGNLSWLNYATIVLCLACFDDRFYRKLFNITLPTKLNKNRKQIIAAYIYAMLAGVLSINTVKNFFSSRQVMNSSFDPLHLVNTYGAFGSVTPVRNEIIIEGSMDGKEWKEYEFKGKPGDIYKTPPLVSPYHYKLDWQMWFAAMGVYQHNPWFLNLCSKLLQNDSLALSLIQKAPFENKAPIYIRAHLYEYHFTEIGERGWWKRRFVREYLPPIALQN
ncbi:MAG: lipase maturation factor family protein [Oligoflexia bacterium]|nr:lipase maturation factor family protein [Oligoflexia bacterium]